MMLKKFNVLSSYALATMVTLFMVLIGGCDRREEVYPLEDHAYARDPEYLDQLQKQIEKKEALVERRFALDREYRDLLKQVNGRVESLTNTVQGAALMAAILEVEKQIASNRVESASIIRARVERARRDSERIRLGEAKAIDISKKEAKQ